MAGLVGVETAWSLYFGSRLPSSINGWNQRGKREMYHKKFPCSSEDLETLARVFDSTKSEETKSTVPSYISHTQRNLRRNLKFEECIQEHLGVQLRSAVLALIDLIATVHHILEAPEHCWVFEWEQKDAVVNGEPNTIYLWMTLANSKRYSGRAQTPSSHVNEKIRRSRSISVGCKDLTKLAMNDLTRNHAAK